MATQAEIGAHIKMASRGVSDLAKKLNWKAGISLDDARLSYIEYIREIAAGRSTEDGYDLAKERARLSKWQADKAEVDYLVSKGDLVPIEQIIDHWSSMLANVRARMLTMPRVIAQSAITAESLSEIEIAAEELINQALSELSNDGIPKEVKQRRDASAEATTKNDSQPVGRQPSKVKPRKQRRTRAVANQ